MTRKKAQVKDIFDIIVANRGESALKDAENNIIDKPQIESNVGKSNRIEHRAGDARISVYITADNLAFLEEYQRIYRIPKASKASELLNKEIEKMRKESI